MKALIPTTITCLGHGGAFAAADVGHTAYLVEHGTHRILVDCGSTVPDVLKEFGIDPGSLTAIVITHLHADHVGGLERVLYHRHYVSKAAPIPLIMGKDTAKAWQACLAATHSGLEHHVAPADQIEQPATNSWYLDDTVEIDAIQTNHGGDVTTMACYSFLLTVGSSAIFFSGDRTWRHENDRWVFKAMEHADIVFHELELHTPPSGAHTNLADMHPGCIALVDRRYWWGHHGRNTRRAEEAPALNLTQKGDKWLLLGRAAARHQKFGANP